MKKIFCAVLIFISLLGAPAIARAMQPEIAAGGAVLMDLNSSRILAGKNAHEHLPMASTTKIMTALLAIENCNMQDMVTVPVTACGTEGSSMYLKPGEKLTMEDLLYGLMLTSGNDAAITIAVQIGKSQEGFAQLMNTRARQLGCNNTNFVTPNGLPDENHYTSAYDLALIACAAMKNETFRQVVNTQYWQTKTGDITRTLKNKNRILWEYDGGNGIKTGFTKTAGRCLAFSAQRQGRTLIGIVLNSPDMWNNAKAMLNYGFDEHIWEQYAKAGESFANLNIIHGMKNNLELLAKEDILIPLRKDEQKSAVELRKIMPAQIDAPVFAGQAVGKLEAWCEGHMLFSVPLVAAQSVMRKEYPFYLRRIIQDFIA